MTRMPLGWRALRATAVGVLVVCGLLGAYAVLGRWVLHGPVTAQSLGTSTAIEAGGSTGSFPDGCTRLPGERSWRCRVLERSGSGASDYRIRVREGSSCWDGRLTMAGSEEPMPRRIDGCVHRWQWSLL